MRTAETEPFTVDFLRFSVDEQPTTLPSITLAPTRYQTLLMPINW